MIKKNKKTAQSSPRSSNSGQGPALITNKEKTDDNNLPYLRHIVQLRTTRGKNILFYKRSYNDSTWEELNFLLSQVMKTVMKLPEIYEHSVGTSISRKNRIIPTTTIQTLTANVYEFFNKKYVNKLYRLYLFLLNNTTQLF